VSSNAQVSAGLSDVLARLECKLNQFQFAVQTPKARAAALATVDQDIDAAKRLILSMLARHNALVPISVLPAEILARIFHFNAFSAQPYSPTLRLGWVSVTHVCRRWRQVALDDSTLWAHFSDYPRNKEWVAERLSRARNAPLVIDLSGAMHKDAVSLFPPHISHTRELYLRNLSFSHSEIVHEVNIQKAPALERLELNVTTASPVGMKHPAGQPLFKGPLPELRILSVYQILLPWSLVPRGRLTQLEVTLNKEVITSVPGVSPHHNLNQLIDLLANCPALEVLTLKNCLPNTVSESSGGPTVHLPRLSRLCLTGSGSRITNLLKMLKLSSSTTLRMDCRPEYVPTLNGHPILPVLSAHFNDPTPTEFRSFKLNLDYEDLVIGMVVSTSLPTSPIPHAHVIHAVLDTDAELSLSFSFLHAHEFKNLVDIILRRASEVLPLSKLEFLSVFSPVMTQTINWGEVFRQCTEVTTVQVHGYGTTGILQGLTPPQRSRGQECKRGRTDNGRGPRGRASNHNSNDSSGSAPVQVPIFPKLTSLLLEMLDFNDMVPGSGILHDLILSVVKQRKARKTPLSRLCITHCVISVEEAVAFEKVVSDVQWDHDEGDDNDEDEDDEDDDEDDDDYDYDAFDYGDDYSDIYGLL